MHLAADVHVMQDTKLNLVLMLNMCRAASTSWPYVCTCYSSSFNYSSKQANSRACVPDTEGRLSASSSSSSSCPTTKPCCSAGLSLSYTQTRTLFTNSTLGQRVLNMADLHGGTHPTAHLMQTAGMSLLLFISLYATRVNLLLPCFLWPPHYQVLVLEQGVHKTRPREG